jgi:hypothetical protein
MSRFDVARRARLPGNVLFFEAARKAFLDE